MSHCTSVRYPLLLCLLLPCLSFVPQTAAAETLTELDALWVARSRGEVNGRALSGPIEEVIAASEAALSAEPERIDVRWRLLRALHFSGEYVERDENSERQIFERAVYLGDEGFEQIERQLGLREPLHEMDPERILGTIEESALSRSAVARLYFWSAINLGAWSQHVGTLRVVRKGVANLVRDYTKVTIALEPEYEEGGAYRLLGRIHTVVPRIPVVSAWVEPEEALAMVARAYAISPSNPGNQLLYAMTLREFAPERRAQAIELFESVSTLTPRPDMRIEDLLMRKQASEALERARLESE